MDNGRNQIGGIHREVKTTIKVRLDYAHGQIFHWEGGEGISIHFREEINSWEEEEDSS